MALLLGIHDVEDGKTQAKRCNVRNCHDVTCRMQAFTSRIYVPIGQDGQGFSETYRRACERIAADPNTPKYAAIDIIMWLTLSDPDILAAETRDSAMRILDNDENQISNCWKCLTTIGMSDLLHGFPKDAVEMLKGAAFVVKRDTGTVPEWLSDKVKQAAGEAAKQAQ